MLLLLYEMLANMTAISDLSPNHAFLIVKLLISNILGHLERLRFSKCIGSGIFIITITIIHTSLLSIHAFLLRHKQQEGSKCFFHHHLAWDPL